MNRLFLAVTIILIISCEKYEMSSIDVENQSKYEIRDTLLLNTIASYIEEVGLEKDSDYLMLHISDDDKYYLSKHNSELTLADNDYIGYSKINDVFILFITKGIQRMENLALQNEIAGIINNELSNLESGFLGDLTHPPYWEITFCQGSMSVRKDTHERNPYRMRELPCNYSIYRDSLNYNSLYIQMDN